MKKRRLLYISTIEEGPYQGVKAKISMQCNAFEENGFEVERINSGKRTFWGQLSKVNPFSYGLNYKIIKKIILSFENKDFDYCYVRYSPASRGLIDVLRTLKQMSEGVKIILEIPTYPYENEFKTLKDVPFKIRERVFRGKLKNYVDLIVTPSYLESTEIFGVPALEITNGINVDEIQMRSPDNCNSESINLLGIALITQKQGFDRVIRGIHEYYRIKNTTEPDINFYIIGDGDAKDELIAMSNDLNLNEHIIFVGQKEKNELDIYYNTADLGVGTLGLYKTNELIKVNSLKTREYCAKGLPFIITDCDYMFADKGFEFAYVISNSDSTLNIQEVISWLVEKKNHYSDTVIIERMNVFAREYLSWRKILGCVIEEVDNIK